MRLFTIPKHVPPREAAPRSTAIPKCIYQTGERAQVGRRVYRSVRKMLKLNGEYEYRFFDDSDVVEFIREEFDERIVSAYLALNIGAAKADLWRYLVLYRRGGIYLDLDSGCRVPFRDIVRPDDVAVIAEEDPKTGGFFVQWALIFAPGHPFLERTIELVLNNIEARASTNVHEVTGPTPYSNAIRQILRERSDVEYRSGGIDYDGKLRFKIRGAKRDIYETPSQHWRGRTDLFK